MARRLLLWVGMTLATFAALVLLSATSPQAPAPAPTGPTPSEVRAEERAHERTRYTDRMHSELSFGFLGEWRDDSPRSWELQSADAPAGAGSLTAPFAAAPFAGNRAAGMTVESRVVYDWVRFSLGLRWPFASYRMTDAVSSVDFGGATHEVMVRQLSMFGVRTGIGLEVPFGLATPFVDVTGDVEHLTSTLAIDGANTSWSSTGFALGVRTGIRVQVSAVFLMLSAEANALGAPRFGGSLQAGVAI